VTTVSLAELLAARDESLRARPTPLLARWARRLARIDLRPVWRICVMVVLHMFGFGMRHGLVLAACTAFVVGAATLSATAAWITAGAALVFLEARRR
jgi:hypothetical protein